MNITNFEVYELTESVVAAGLPMQAEYNEGAFQQKILDLCSAQTSNTEKQNPDFVRACRLANNPPGSGHCNFLSGILVSANITATNVWWLQMERYHFVQIVSMQSKMHRLRKMLRDCSFTYPKDLMSFEPFRDAAQSIDIYTDEELACACPMGLELTARVSTNYLQLKTIYAQRKDHKLQEWRDFCSWIKSLPYAKEWLLGQEEEK